MKNLPRTLLLLAALLAIAASIQTFTFTTEVREWIMDPEGAYEEIYQETFYNRDGPWGVILLLISTSLYAAPYLFFRKERIRLSAAFAVLAITLSYLADFAIGPNYVPATGALLLAFTFLGIARIRQC